MGVSFEEIDMQSLQIISPILAITLVGYIAARSGLLKTAEVQAVSKFVFTLVIPALLFKSTSQATLPDSFEWEFLASFYLAVLFIYMISVLLSKHLFEHNSYEQSVFGLGASYSNTVIIGIPVCYSALGEESLLPLFAIISVHNAVLSTMAIFLAERRVKSEASRTRHILMVIKQSISSPITGSLFLGLLFNLLNISIYSPVEKALSMVSNAAIPCALLVLGASLNEYKAAKQLNEAIVMVALKNIVLPFTVWLLAFHFFSVSPLWASTALIASAMPTGINAYIFAKRYRACESSVATGIILSTVISIGSISALLYYLT